MLQVPVDCSEVDRENVESLLIDATPGLISSSPP